MISPTKNPSSPLTLLVVVASFVRIPFAASPILFGILFVVVKVPVVVVRIVVAGHKLAMERCSLDDQLPHSLKLAQRSHLEGWTCCIALPSP